jgi:hypothetical protein
VEEKARTHADALGYKPPAFADCFFPRADNLVPVHNSKLLGVPVPVDVHHGEEQDGEANWGN